MQTFVPYPDNRLTAEVLDLRRLGKQLIECQQIFRSLNQDDYGWKNHPAVKMWRGHDWGLWVYSTEMHAEWRKRRGKDHGAWVIMRNLVLDKYNFKRHRGLMLRDDTPSWWGNNKVHESHRSKLLQKDYEFYKDLMPADTPLDLDYFWPV